MRIPYPPQLPANGLPDLADAYIINPYPKKDILTPQEALECINKLTELLLMDKRYRKAKDGS